MIEIAEAYGLLEVEVDGTPLQIKRHETHDEVELLDLPSVVEKGRSLRRFNDDGNIDYRCSVNREPITTNYHRTEGNVWVPGARDGIRRDLRNFEEGTPEHNACKALEFVADKLPEMTEVLGTFYDQLER